MRSTFTAIPVNDARAARRMFVQQAADLRRGIGFWHGKSVQWEAALRASLTVTKNAWRRLHPRFAKTVNYQIGTP